MNKAKKCSREVRERAVATGFSPASQKRRSNFSRADAQESELLYREEAHDSRRRRPEPNRGGAPEGTPELYFTDPDGILLQLQDPTYCGGNGYLGDECGSVENPTGRNVYKLRWRAGLTARARYAGMREVSGHDADADLLLIL